MGAVHVAGTKAAPLQIAELIELFKRTFRGVHLLAYLKRGELAELGRPGDFERAAESARTVQDETLGLDDEAEDT